MARNPALEREQAASLTQALGIPTNSSNNSGIARARANQRGNPAPPAPPAPPADTAPAGKADTAPLQNTNLNDSPDMGQRIDRDQRIKDSVARTFAFTPPQYSADDLTRRAIDLASSAEFMPRYESRTAINIPNRQQAMRENLAMERAAKQGDFYDRMNQVGFVTPDLLRMAIQDRQASRALAADSVREGGRQGLLSQKQALDEARLAEEIGQAEYKSGVDRNAMQRDLAQILANAGLQQRATDVAELGNILANNLGVTQANIGGLETYIDLTRDSVTGQDKDPFGRSQGVRDLLEMLGLDPEKYAEPGRVRLAEGGEVSMENPTAEGKTAGLDTGDYVFPAEAVRFYGMKTIKAMVEKAMMADDA